MWIPTSPLWVGSPVHIRVTMMGASHLLRVTRLSKYTGSSFGGDSDAPGAKQTSHMRIGTEANGWPPRGDEGDKASVNFKVRRPYALMQPPYPFSLWMGGAR